LAVPSATVLPPIESWYAVPGSVTTDHRLRLSRSVPGSTAKPLAAGGVASTASVTEAGSLTLPAASVATTRYVCAPVPAVHDKVWVVPSATALATTSVPSRTTSAESPSAWTGSSTSPPGCTSASPKEGRAGAITSGSGCLSSRSRAGSDAGPLPGAGCSAA
jgi:hypothetical protein